MDTVEFMRKQRKSNNLGKRRENIFTFSLLFHLLPLPLVQSSFIDVALLFFHLPFRYQTSYFHLQNQPKQKKCIIPIGYNYYLSSFAKPSYFCYFSFPSFLPLSTSYKQKINKLTSQVVKTSNSNLEMRQFPFSC